MTSAKINTKTIARIAAVQAIYQYKPEDPKHNIEKIIQQIIQFYQDERAANSLTTNLTASLNKPIKVKLSISHFELLVKSVVVNLPQIDKMISRHLTAEWQITSLPVLLLALLRVAICELQFFPNVPNKVVINEFTDITNDMLSEGEVGFVNSVLDRIAKISSENFEEIADHDI
ncbi:transcription antitermination factor NusB [Rickettsia endosymbiont of Oedothorax gibbosus]|uniref:transcription antitermination factor NusB n=1 Tax=Rickettsia endosymbiont of Oedothorax gibbosus TaxID=931099 RepID=UPI0020257D50|nr:transcription antitermination factor NusB [Rickettsia endosymbiont of Oedothorax gibbosus]